MKKIMCYLMVLLMLFVCAGNKFVAYADDSFTINGKTIPSNGCPADGSNKYCSCGIPVGSSGHWCCWDYAAGVYQYIWGQPFNRCADNLLRNVAAADRKLTADNLKKYLSQAKPGANVRIGNEADWYAGDNYGHSLIFLGFSNSQKTAAYFAEGNYNGRGNTRIYNWSFSELASKYNYYTYVKYIIFPGAPEYNEAITPSVVTIGNYWIKLKGTDLYLGFEGEANKGSYVRALVTQTVWKFAGNPDSYEISIAGLDAVLNTWVVETVTDGSEIRFYPSTGHSSQRWILLKRGDYYVIASAQNPSLVITVASNGSLYLKKDTNQDAQLFSLITPSLMETKIPPKKDNIKPGWYYIRWGDKYISLESLDNCKNGTDFCVVAKKQVPFIVEGEAGHNRAITADGKNIFMNVWTDNIVRKTCRITAYTNTGHSSQRFILREVTDGYVILSAQNTSLAVTVNSNNKLVIDDYTGGKNQVFKFEKCWWSGGGTEDDGETISPTPKPTSTPKPTNTPKPTSTPKPTNTPKPTSTPKPTNIPLSEDTCISMDPSMDNQSSSQTVTVSDQPHADVSPENEPSETMREYLSNELDEQRSTIQCAEVNNTNTRNSVVQTNSLTNGHENIRNIDDAENNKNVSAEMISTDVIILVLLVLVVVFAGLLAIERIRKPR